VECSQPQTAPATPAAGAQSGLRLCDAALLLGEGSRDPCQRAPASGQSAVVSVLFFSIAVHCIRHRHLFLEMTNLRELLDGRFDPTNRAPRRPIGGVAFDS